jgi:hypothetical protein
LSLVLRRSIETAPTYQKLGQFTVEGALTLS